MRTTVILILKLIFLLFTNVRLTMAGRADGWEHVELVLWSILFGIALCLIFRDDDPPKTTLEN